MKNHRYAGGAGLLAMIIAASCGFAFDRVRDVTPGQVRDVALNQVRVFASTEAYMTASVKTLERGFLGSLNHDVPGVVESALGEITRFKLAQPHAVSPRIADRIDELATEGETAAIRYKASLASLVFRFPSMFTVHQYTYYVTSEQLFTDIARRLEQQVLAIRIE